MGGERSEARGRAETGEVVADLNEAHGGADLIEARDGLQALPSPGVASYRELRKRGVTVW